MHVLNLVICLWSMVTFISGQPTVEKTPPGSGEDKTSHCSSEIQVLYTIINKLQHDDQLMQSKIDMLYAENQILTSEVATVKNKIDIFEKKGQRTCLDLYMNDIKEDGVYTVYINGNINKPKSVYCDMTTNGGGWTVFQRRFDGSVDFYRNWKNYTSGFGDIGGEHWLGNEVVAEMTSLGSYVLRIDLEGFEGDVGWAEYTDFSISDESDGFRLSVKQYTGNMGDAIINGNEEDQSGQQFSTFDRDNDKSSSDNCAERYHGAFWFHSCLDVHLNGRYSESASVFSWQGIMWDLWKGNRYSARKSAMKFRPANF